MLSLFVFTKISETLNYPIVRLYKLKIAENFIEEDMDIFTSWLVCIS